MKKRVIGSIFLILISISFASAVCNLDASLINQDPYPAIPGEYVKVVFQLTGTSDPSCGRITFNLNEEFPFSLDPNTNDQIEIISGTYTPDYSPYLIAPYKLRVDNSAIEGENIVKVSYQYKTELSILAIEEEFNITIEDSRSEFEVHIKDYSLDRNILTFEILNIGESDVEALTVELKNQENLKLLGPERVIVGEVDSNEEDTATFEAEPNEGNINLIILYTDQTGTRRVVEKTVGFTPENFPENGVKKSRISPTTAFVLGIILTVAGWFTYRKLKKRKDKKHKLTSKHKLLLGK